MYPDILKHYTWNKATKTYSERSRRRSCNNESNSPKSDTIGRIPVVAFTPKNQERYFLRLLLHHVKGPKSYQDLKTVDGEICDTFQAACIKLGIWDGDDEIEKSLEEAASIKFASGLRHCFVTMLIYAMPANPRELYEKFKEELCLDFAKRDRATKPTEAHMNEALLELQQCFNRNGMDMVKDFYFPEPVRKEPKDKEISRDVLDEIDNFYEGLSDQAQENIAMLNPDQKKLFDLVAQSVENNNGDLFALDAPGGTGKTFMLTTLLSYVR